ncbi:MAG: decaprenyl-phosphate phosphoribosyltransferase, partial [Bacillota bacterium]
IFRGIISAMRPRQWSKNLLIFAGIIFSRNLLNPYLLFQVFLGFMIFSLVSGTVYLVNDINDIEQDKQHPRKRHRPLPSGQITVKQALMAVIVILLSALTAAFYINIYFGLVTLIYFLTIGLYTFYLKHLVILDVLTIAFGFVLRAIAGVVLVRAHISPWLIICTILLALFLALSKRRHELTILDDKAGEHRGVLEKYSVSYLDQMITIVAAGTIVAYSLYTFNSDKSVYLMATIPFVIYGIFRYLYLIHIQNRGGSPEAILLEDRPLLLNIVCWGFTSIFILYFI